MGNGTSVFRVLLVSAAPKSAAYLRELLPEEHYRPVLETDSAEEARRLLRTASPDLLLIVSPLPGESGVALALEAASGTAAGILLLVRKEAMAALPSSVEDAGIIVLPRPNTRQNVAAGIHLAAATRARLRTFEEKTATLEIKLSEVKLVNRAKLLIMQRLKMSESEAHKYIERKAMDTCTRRAEVAADIIRVYEE